MPMTRREIDRFLAQPNVAVVAVTAPDGHPHAVPTWYEYRRGEVSFVSDTNAFKAKCLRRDPRIAMCFDTRTWPYKAVILKGRAKLEERVADRLMERMAVAYMGAKRGRAYARTFKGQKLTVISFRPIRQVSWDYSRDG